MSSIDFESVELNEEATSDPSENAILENPRVRSPRWENATNVAYATAVVLAAVFAGSKYINTAINTPVQAEVRQENPDLSQAGSLETITIGPSPQWAMPVAVDRPPETLYEGSTYITDVIDAGYMGFSLTVDAGLLGEPLSPEFSEDIQTIISILNRSVTPKTFSDLVGTKFHIRYEIKESGQKSEAGFEVSRSRAGIPMTRVNRKIEIPMDQIEMYAPTEKIILLDFIRTYLSYCNNLDPYNPEDTRIIQIISQDIQGYVLNGSPYSEYQNAYGINIPVLSADDYADLLDIFHNKKSRNLN